MNSSFLTHSSAASRKVRPTPHSHCWPTNTLPPSPPLAGEKYLGRLTRADRFQVSKRCPKVSPMRLQITRKNSLPRNRSGIKKKACVARAKQITLSQNGYGTKVPLRVTLSDCPENSRKKNGDKMRAFFSFFSLSTVCTPAK